MGSAVLTVIALAVAPYLANTNTNATPGNAFEAVASFPDSRQLAASLCRPV